MGDDVNSEEIGGEECSGVRTEVDKEGEIPGIVELTAGMNVTEEIENMHGYTLALRITFENKQALDHYLPHPTHQDFVASLNGIIDNVIVIDYEI